MNIYETLKELGIEYKTYEHLPVFTVEESLKHKEEVPGERNKSLLLRNKDKSSYYLVIIYGEKRINQNSLQKDLRESRLSFASPEDLKQKLNTTPGSVSPYTLINNKEKDIVVIIDDDVLKSDKVYFHPDRNSATLEMSTIDFKKFVTWTKNKVLYKKI